MKFVRLVLPVLVMPALVAFTWPWTVNRLGQQGLDDWHKGDYPGASEQYRSALDAAGESPELLYNLGTSVYGQRDYARAADILGRVHTNDKSLAAKAAYNRGNCLYRLGQWQAAADAYKRALDLDPGDADARYNYDLCQERLKKECEKPEDQQPKPDAKPNPQCPNPGQTPGAGQGNPQPGPQPPPKASPKPGALSKSEADAILERAQRSERQTRSRWLLNPGQRSRGERSKLGVPSDFWSRNDSDEKDW